MLRRRKENLYLPKRVYWKNGAYRMTIELGVVDGKRKQRVITLGRTQSEMYKRYLDLTDRSTAKTMNEILEMYMAEEAREENAEKTFREKVYQVKNLRAVFGHMYPEDIEPNHVWEYVLERKKAGAPVMANREKSLLSMAFKYAKKKGYAKINPCDDISGNKERPRDRYITHKEFIAVKRFAEKSDPIMAPVLMLAYSSFQRRQDLIRITERDLLAQGIYFEQGKSLNSNRTVKKLIIAWNKRLRKAIKQLQDMRQVKSEYLICQENGNRYTDDAMSKKWQRLIDSAMQQGIVKQRFTFHDIRAKAVSDADTVEKGSRAAGHTNIGVTKRHYDRKARVVES